MAWIGLLWGLAATANNGGSDDAWPKNKWLSFWGFDGDVVTGGCCSTSTAVGRTDGDNWKLSFTLSYGLPLHPSLQTLECR